MITLLKTKKNHTVHVNLHGIIPRIGECINIINQPELYNGYNPEINWSPIWIIKNVIYNYGSAGKDLKELQSITIEIVNKTEELLDLIDDIENQIIS